MFSSFASESTKLNKVGEGSTPVGAAYVAGEVQVSVFPPESVTTSVSPAVNSVVICHIALLNVFVISFALCLYLL